MMIRNLFMVLVVISMGCTQETLVTQSNQPSDNSAKPSVEYVINVNDAQMTLSQDGIPSPSSSRARKYPSRPLDVSSLPQTVVAEEGVVTLYADYDDIWQNHFVLYVVNKSANSVRIPKEDTDFYIKLETMTDGGEWQRAQTHEYSWCGNSYHSVDLEPNKFISTLGWKPSSGVNQNVRYRFYSGVQVASNIGTALVDPDIVLSAKNDQMSEVLAGKTDTKAVR